MLKKQEVRFKSFLQMQGRLDEIRRELRELPSVPLKEPYQDGWLVKYDLREDIRRRADVSEIRAVLKLGFNAYRYTNKVSEVKDIRKGLKFGSYTYRKKKVRIDYAPVRRLISEVQYQCLSPALKSYFYLDTTSDVYRIYSRKYYFAVLPGYWLILKAKPNIITHTRKKGGPLEEEEAYLLGKLREFWREYGADRCHSDWNLESKRRRNSKDKVEIRAKIQKFKKGELEEIY